MEAFLTKSANLSVTQGGLGVSVGLPRKHRDRTQAKIQRVQRTSESASRAFESCIMNRDYRYASPNPLSEGLSRISSLVDAPFEVSLVIAFEMHFPFEFGLLKLVLEKDPEAGASN